MANYNNNKKESTGVLGTLRGYINNFLYGGKEERHDEENRKGGYNIDKVSKKTSKTSNKKEEQYSKNNEIYSYTDTHILFDYIVTLYIEGENRYYQFRLNEDDVNGRRNYIDLYRALNNLIYFNTIDSSYSELEIPTNKNDSTKFRKLLERTTIRGQFVNRYTTQPQDIISLLKEHGVNDVIAKEKRSGRIDEIVGIYHNGAFYNADNMSKIPSIQNILHNTMSI